MEIKPTANPGTDVVNNAPQLATGQPFACGDSSCVPVLRDTVETNPAGEPVGFLIEEHGKVNFVSPPAPGREDENWTRIVSAYGRTAGEDEAPSPRLPSEYWYG
jgi:hypothetical protein